MLLRCVMLLRRDMLLRCDMLLRRDMLLRHVMLLRRNMLLRRVLLLRHCEKRIATKQSSHNLNHLHLHGIPICIPILHYPIDWHCSQ